MRHVFKEKFKYLVIITAAITVGITTFQLFKYCSSEMIIKMKTSENGRVKIFWGPNSIDSIKIRKSEKFITYYIPVPKSEVGQILVRPINKVGRFEIQAIGLKSCRTVRYCSGQELNQKLVPLIDIEKIRAPDVFSGKTTSKKSLLTLGGIYPDNKFNIFYRVGLATILMLFTAFLGLKINWSYLKQKKIQYIVLVFLIIIFIDFPASLSLEIVSPQNTDFYQLFIDTGNGFQEKDSRITKIFKNEGISTIVFKLPSKKIKALRIDPGNNKGDIIIKSIYLESALKKRRYVQGDKIKPIHHIGGLHEKDEGIFVTITGNDPHFLLYENYPALNKWISSDSLKLKLFLFIISTILAAGLLLARNSKFLLLIKEKFKYLEIKTSAIINGKIKKFEYIGFGFLFIPGILGVLYVFLFGVNVPYWDEWAIVPLFEKFHSGTLTFSDFFGQHLEHRILFPRIVILILGLVTKFNSIIEMIVIQCLLFVVLLVIFLKLKKQFGFNTAAIPVWFLPISILVFSWRQYETLLWGWHIVYVMPLVCSLLSFYFIDRLNQKGGKKGTKKHIFNFILAISFAVIASYSMIIGLLVWIAGIFQLLFLSNKNLKKHIYIGAWIISGITMGGIYFLDYSKFWDHRSVFFIFSHPFDFFKSFITLLGNSLFWNARFSYLAGIIILLLIILSLIHIYKTNLIRGNSFWLTIMFFSFMVCGAISMGRGSIGIDRLLQSRYTSYSIPIVVALYILILHSIYRQRKPKLMKIAFGTILILIAAGNFASYTNGFKIGKEIRHERETQALSLLKFETQPNEALKGLYPSVEHLRHLAKILKKLKYSVFSGCNRKKLGTLKKSSDKHYPVNRYMSTNRRTEIEMEPHLNM
jgi:hypothetical protein